MIKETILNNIHATIKEQTNEKVCDFSLQEIEENLNKTQIKSPNSRGVYAGLKNGAMKNKPLKLKPKFIYWVMNIITPTKKHIKW